MKRAIVLSALLFLSCSTSPVERKIIYRSGTDAIMISESNLWSLGERRSEIIVGHDADGITTATVRDEMTKRSTPAIIQALGAGLAAALAYIFAG